MTDGTSAGFLEKNFFKYQTKKAILQPSASSITMAASTMWIGYMYTADKMHCTITASVWRGAITAINATIDHCKLMLFILPSTSIAFFLSLPKNTTIVNKKAAIRKGNQSTLRSSPFAGMQTLLTPLKPAGHEPRQVSFERNSLSPQVRH